MSLVSEALRKARQEEAQREALRRGSGVPVSFTARGGRGLRSTFSLVALLVVAAAGLGAATAWWVLSSREQQATHQASAPSPTENRQPESTVGAALPAHAVGQDSAAPAQSASSPAGQTPADDRATLPPPPAAASAAASQPAAGAHDPPSAAPGSGASGPGTAPAEPAAAAPGNAPGEGQAGRQERSFVLTAELGYATLHLDFIVFKRSAPWAGVNGQQIVPGSIVDGFLVEEIGADFVRLRDRHGGVVLRVR